jgi:hypothetical protein
MTDKDFLNKVSIAYKAYVETVGPNLAIENFIDWLYKQYGIVKSY